MTFAPKHAFEQEKKAGQCRKMHGKCTYRVFHEENKAFLELFEGTIGALTTYVLEVQIFWFDQCS